MLEIFYFFLDHTYYGDIMRLEEWSYAKVYYRCSGLFIFKAC